MAKGKQVGFSTSIEQFPTNTKPNVPKVVQGNVLSQSWEELLDLAATLPPRTRAEVVMGRITLLKHKIEEENNAYKNMMEWGTFHAEVEACMNNTQDATTLFRLQDFTDLNEKLVKAMERWNIRGVKAAVVRIDHFLRVKAITSAGSIIFDEDPEGFPSEELMTKIQLINPEN